MKNTNTLSNFAHGKAGQLDPTKQFLVIKKKESIMRKKKQKYSMSEFQRLLCSWTMELASYFEDECDMDQKTALEKAHLNRSLQMYLGDGVVTFYYEKDDGTVRKARGTLEHGISRKFDEYVYVRGRDSYEYEWPREDFTYWDLDKEQFRTFKASRLLKIEAYSAVNVLHEKI